MSQKNFGMLQVAAIALLGMGLAAPAFGDNPKKMDPGHDDAMKHDDAMRKGDAADRQAYGSNNPEAMDAKADADDERGSDVWAEASIVTSYTLNTQLNPFDISADVENGRATLTGTVESEIEKNLAGEIARGADGVTSVDNQIRVDPKVAYDQDREENGFFRSVSNATTAAQVNSKLLWNSNTSGTDINVAASGSTVTLTGTVASDAERQLAEEIALNTDGVRRVDNQLKVDPDHKSMAEAAETTVSDAWITTKVKSTLAYSRNVSALDINVDTNEGEVTLTGTVESKAQGQEALDLARNVVGVKNVNDQLTIENQMDAAAAN